MRLTSRCFLLLIATSLLPSIVHAKPRECVPAGPRVALTFDDGPWPNWTSNVLQTLRERGAPATFFMVGQRARSVPHMVRAVQEEGHEIGLHSDTHASLNNLSPRQAAGQMTRNLQALEDAAPGVYVHAWRAPYGALPSGPVRLAINEATLNRPHILWSLDTNDWQRPSQQVFLDRMSRWHDGAIVLMHEHTQATQAWLAPAMDDMIAHGVVFVRVSELQLPACDASRDPPLFAEQQPPTHEQEQTLAPGDYLF